MAEIRTGTLTWLYIKGKPAVLGESLDVRHYDEIQVLNFHIEVDTPESATDETTTAKSKNEWKPDFKPITIDTVPGYGSGELFVAAARGTQFDSITISCRKSGVFIEKEISAKDPRAGYANGDYTQWRFYKCRINNWTLKHDLDVPSESITFSYEAVEMIYLEQEMGGTLKYVKSASWDRKANNGKGDSRTEKPELPWINEETGPD